MLFGIIVNINLRILTNSNIYSRWQE